MFKDQAQTPLDDRGSLADSVYARLRDSISDGTLHPGFRLREVEIAQHFDVSTTPVREALRRLEYDGLVKSNPRKGSSVAPVDWTEIHSMLIVRELLEVYAVKRVAQTHTTHDFTEVRQILSAQALAAQTDDQQEFSRLDREFHMAIIRMTRNDPLVRFTEQVHMQLQHARSRATGPRKRGMSLPLIEHQNVFDAIENGDVALAEEATHTHVRSSMDAIAALIEDVGPSVRDPESTSA